VSSLSTIFSFSRVHSVCCTPLHLAQISGRCLTHISLPGFRRRTACRVDTYQTTLSPRPESSVRPHADRTPRPMANFDLMTQLFYGIVISVFKIVMFSGVYSLLHISSFFCICSLLIVSIRPHVLYYSCSFGRL